MNVKKILPVTVTVTLLTALLPYVTSAYNQSENCNFNGVCTLLVSDLPNGAANLPPNTNVTLTFAVYKAGNQNDSNICPSGKNVYYFLKHYSGSSADFNTGGSAGAAFTYNFNSGNTGNQNKYVGFFYCDVGPTTTHDYQTIYDKLTNLGDQSQMWYTNTFEMTTASGSASAQIVFSPSPTNNTYAPGTAITIAAQNLPDALGPTSCGQGANSNSNFHAELNLNGQTTKFFCFPYPFTIKDNAVEGTIDMTGGNNKLQVTIYDSSNNMIAQSSISFTVGQPPTGGGQPGSGGPGSGGPGGGAPGGGSTYKPPFDCTAQGADKDSNYRLYCIINPLPTAELTTMVLLIMRGFLFIVGIWAVVFIIIGGFKMIMAQGNEEAYTAARKTVTWAILGLVIALLSFSIVAIVQNFLGAKPPSFGYDQQQKIEHQI